jgi:hypothetical protein
MRALRLLVLILGVACLVVTFSVNYSRTATAGGEVSELRIGFEPSPWVRREVRDGAGSFEVNILSGSALFALGAAACFAVYGLLGRRLGAPDRQARST